VFVSFGAAQGAAARQPPQGAAAALTEVQAAPPPRPANPLTDNIGLLLFGAAGVVLVIGGGLSLWLRGRALKRG
jgi:hypothetical protein